MQIQIAVSRTEFRVPVFFLHAIETEDGPMMSFEDFKTLYVSMYDEPQFGLILDLSAFANTPWSYVPLLIQLLQELRPRTEVQLIGSTTIVTSSIVRWLVDTAIQQYPMCKPHKMVETLDDACSFIQSL